MLGDMTIQNPQDAERILERVNEMLDSGRYAEAITLADSCEGDDQFVDAIRAIACTHAGEALQDEAVLERGLALWRALGGENDNAQAYNLANAEHGAWRVAVKKRGFPTALAQSREHLHRARALYRRAGDDSAVPFQLRVQALTNLGNSYDELGRDVEALAAYEEVLSMDSDFAMALGNRGTTLMGIAPFMGQHQPRVIHDAARALDAALADPDQVKRFGGQSALTSFEQHRSRIKVEHTHDEPNTTKVWTDAYLRWCAERSLFLHVSQACTSDDVQDLDPLFLNRLISGLSEDEQARVYDLVDAFNALKQDYVAARYLLWLAADPESPIQEHALAATKRTRFLDTYKYGDWGVRSGLAAQAFAGAINLLDKVASFTHLYFNTSRRSKRVYLHNLWRSDGIRHGSANMDPELAAQFEQHGNRGLLALCDLSCDLEQDTPLNRMVDRRHSATHRFLAIHWMLIEDNATTGTGWLDHVEWDDLLAGAVQQLATARAALIYLARLIDIAEQLAESKREEQADGPRQLGHLPLTRTVPIDLH